MRQVGIVAAAVLILISVPCDGDSSDTTDNESLGQETPSTPPKTSEFPRGANDGSITHNVGDVTYVSVWDKILYPLNHGESTEEQPGYTNSAYTAPSTVNFLDTYSNSLVRLLAEGIIGSTIKTQTTEPYKEPNPRTTPKHDKSFHLSNVHTQFVKFHPKTQTIPPWTMLSPKFPLNATFVKKSKNKTSTTTTTTTEEPKDLVEVIPIKKENEERGLLDLLFPAARVRTFKSVFDTFRRIMSQTFR